MVIRALLFVAWGTAISMTPLQVCCADEQVGLAEKAVPVEKVDSSAIELRIGSLRINKVLFLGNSITLHGPAPKIGWNGNWGMAASSLEKDYVHLLSAQLAKAAGGKPEVMIKNIADFERNLEAFPVTDGLKEERAFQADLIIVAIGENVSPLTTEAARVQFKTSFTKLLTELKKDGSPTLVVRSQFWADPVKDELMNQACLEVKGLFVDISKLGQDEANYARSEQKFEHAGVAGHPGDKGMQALAKELWKAIERQGSVKPAN